MSDAQHEKNHPICEVFQFTDSFARLMMEVLLDEAYKNKTG